MGFDLIIKDFKLNDLNDMDLQTFFLFANFLYAIKFMP